MKLKVVIQPGEDSAFVVHVPALKGCWSQGSTREGALANVREAIEGWLQAEQDKTVHVDAASRRDVELLNV